uniref:SWIM-type domain-containing protein n=1 Tax=Lactuca sativa TaxID=4236 RepID=A0A9R1WED7_LACSA|nr:hypothetical protein LSAT_V11C200050740 [Lactuca sativa]
MVLSIWCFREKFVTVEDLGKTYEGYENYFTLKIHYSGVFTKAPGRKYVDGVVAYVDYVDTDLFSVHELDDMVRELGYKTEQTLYYHFCIPEYPLDYGLMPLGNDQDVLKMVSYVPKHRLIRVYIETGQTRVGSYYKSPSKVVIEELEPDSVSPEMNRKKPCRREAGSCSRKLDLNKSMNPDYEQSQVLDVDEGHDYSKSILPFIRSQGKQSHVIQKEVVNHEIETQEEVITSAVETEEQLGTYHVQEPSCQADNGANTTTVDDYEPFVEDYSLYADYDAEFNVQNSFEKQPEVDYLEGMVSDDSGDAFYSESGHGFEDSGDDSDDSEYNVDESNIQFDVDVNMSEFHNAVDVDEHGILNNHSKDDGIGVVDFDNELEVIATDDYQFAGFHEDDRKRLLKELSKSSTCSHGEVHVKPFQIGQVFKTKVDVKNYMNSHAVATRRSLYLAKNDKIRIRVKCKGVVSKPSTGVDSGGPSTRSRAKCKGKDVIANKGTCPWAVQISRANENQDWLVKTVQDEHKCLQTRAVKACTSRYVANLIVQQIQSNPKIPVKALHEELCKKLEVGMSLQKVARAKSMAERIISGDYQVQYGFLRDYVLELLNTNPGTTVRIDVYPETSLSVNTRTFRRIYVCLGALKLGFKSGLRDFLGLDGTFMKGPYPGQVLTAVGLDSNNGIYPVAYAVVETESTSSWTWFLELLGEDLDLGPNSNFTFISDRQKGIIPAMEKVFPSAEHRFCLRHIQENMKKQWKGKDLSDQLWECGRATTVNHFNRAMDELKKINAEAHAWVSKIPANTWAKSHFSGRAHTDCLLNNLCEVFNSKLDEGRDKPIITCLEYIREYLMKRLCVVQKEIDKCEGLLTPTATTLFEKIKADASKYVAKYNGAGKYQVASTWQDQYVVNLNDHSCSCRFWEITGFPCRHAVCAIWDKIENGENAPHVDEWVHPCYRLSTWKAMYFNKIDPLNGRTMWPKSDCPFTLLPPKHKTQVGRPKKKRRRGVDEPNSQAGRLSRKYLVVTCSKCHNKGHNSRTCKGQGGSGEVGGG